MVPPEEEIYVRAKINRNKGQGFDILHICTPQHIQICITDFFSRQKLTSGNLRSVLVWLEMEEEQMKEMTEEEFYLCPYDKRNVFINESSHYVTRAAHGTRDIGLIFDRPLIHDSLQ